MSKQNNRKFFEWVTVGSVVAVVVMTALVAAGFSHWIDRLIAGQ